MTTKKTAGTRTSARASAHAPAALVGKRIAARDLQSFRQRLEDELKVLRGHYDGFEAASASSLAGGPGAGGELGDAGAFSSERERDLTLAGNLRDLMEKVQAALRRIDGGSFGRCEVCDQAIEAERLDALPYTTLCLADARRRARVR